ncbi:hypothetical protein Bbelb_313670 [Branchiostoma belcheri]|nr:hypothetical protein Bbelb_313670 [Branchiostoma belcheri]
MEPVGQVVLLAVSLAFVNLAIAEVNVALNKKASQSSLLRSEYPAERAVDGNTGTILYPLKECTHTDLEYEPWWKVDLGDTYVISHVTVINRGDCCGERLRNFMVRVGPYEDFRENTPCGDIYSETPSEGETIDVRCEEPISGRWVSVQLIGREDYLSLCEVQVFSVTDVTQQRLFWTDGGMKRIESITTDGRDRKLLVEDALALPPFGIDVSEDRIFWTDWRFTTVTTRRTCFCVLSTCKNVGKRRASVRDSIMSAEKDTGRNPTVVYGHGSHPFGSLFYFKLIDKDKQPGTSPCAINNGGCSHFCLNTPAGHTCACPDSLQLDGNTCKTDQRVTLSITHPPVDTTGVDGGVITLFCETNMKLNILWKKGGRTIDPSARNRYDVIEYQNGRASVLRIDPLRRTRDNDTFTCRVENVNDGSVKEASAAINILTEDTLPAGFPDIHKTAQPQTKSVQEGRPTVLVCSASGNPAPDITWLKDMVPVDMADDRIKLLSSGFLQINSTHAEDEGTYECVATSSLGTRYSYKANLYVRVAPSITHPPVDTTGVDGDVITLFCEANMKLNMEWRKGGRTIIPSARNRYDVIEYQNGRASALRIDPLRSPRDIGTFTCRVENDNDGSVVEASAAINVLKEDSLPAGFPINRQPQLKAVQEGRPTVLVCSASGNPAPDITWLKDMVPVDMADDRIKLLRSGSLQISSTRKEDEGTYECVATNSLGTRYSYKANLYVRVAPSITRPPVDTTGVDGDVITLFCEANMKLNMEWRKGGRKIIPSARNRYDVIEYQNGRASALRIDPLRSPRDIDTFTCRVENDNDGSVVEASAAINVLKADPSRETCWFRFGCLQRAAGDLVTLKFRLDYASPPGAALVRQLKTAAGTTSVRMFGHAPCSDPEDSLPAGFPDINRQPQLKAVQEGRPTVLVCSASGNPAPDITWLKDMVPVDMADDRIKLLRSGFLQINSTREEDEGTYECVATNSLGTRYSYKANLYVRVRRVPPYFITTPEDVEVNRGDDVNLTCVAFGSPFPFVQWLKDYKYVEDQTKQNGRSFLRLKNVVESANYTCAATSELGLIEYNAEVTVKDPPPMVDGYTARRGGCPGNDIWIIYARSTTLEQCARECTIHPRCVAFQFFDNHECYPKSKSCEETVKTNPKNVLYDKIVGSSVPLRLGVLSARPAARSPLARPAIRLLSARPAIPVRSGPRSPRLSNI